VEDEEEEDKREIESDFNLYYWI